MGRPNELRPPTCRGDEASGAPPGQPSRCVVRIHVTDDAQERGPSGPPGERRWAVLYDAGCGFCTWLLSFVLRWDRAARLHPIALGRPEADDLLQALTPAERMASWHLISPTGERRSGGAAVAALLRVLPGGRLPAGLVRGRENHCHNGARPSPTITASLSRGEQEARLEDVALAVSALSALVG
jgi:hypothetical protein